MSPPEDSARRSLFDRIRQNLAATQPDAVRREAVARRLAEHPRSLIPARASVHGPALVQLFAGFIEGQGGTVLQVPMPAETPSAIARYLRSNNLPARIRMGADPYLAAMPWDTEPALERRLGRAAPDDAVGLTHALAGVAETGTLVVASGADNPVTLSFLPETNIVVLQQANMVGSYEAAWDRLRATFGPGKLPRTVNFISGPSRTADIGGVLVRGAHGPKRLCVVLVGSASTTSQT